VLVVLGAVWLACSTAATPAGAVPGAPACPAPYRAPLRAPVIDGFRLPDGPFRAGNRGLEYATAEGQVVVAIGPGSVSFAGTIAGERYVSVRHVDGLVSSYSYLRTLAVRRGDRVAGGTRLGTTTTRFQLGVRRDGVYLDPAPLLGSAAVRPRLVADDHPPPRC
jgi:murein DD-endopeptidase MepM/ murein hydrolase activator NlpD